MRLLSAVSFGLALALGAGPAIAQVDLYFDSDANKAVAAWRDKAARYPACAAEANAAADRTAKVFEVGRTTNSKALTQATMARRDAADAFDVCIAAKYRTPLKSTVARDQPAEADPGATDPLSGNTTRDNSGGGTVIGDPAPPTKNRPQMGWCGSINVSYFGPHYDHASRQWTNAKAEQGIQLKNVRTVEGDQNITLSVTLDRPIAKVTGAWTPDKRHFAISSLYNSYTRTTIPYSDVVTMAWMPISQC